MTFSEENYLKGYHLTVELQVSNAEEMMDQSVTVLKED
jgi:hypothetical protein